MVWVLALALAQTALAQQWVDVTGLFMQNPRYTNNSITGWNIWAQGNSNTNYNCHEIWNGVGEMTQTMEVPNGHYRVSVGGYYRPGPFNQTLARTVQDADRKANLTANDKSTRLQTVYSESMQSPYGGVNTYNGRYYPNTMQAASHCFYQLGMYHNALEVDVADGRLTVGISILEAQSENWTIWGNWKLEYYGEITQVESIGLSLPTTTLTRGQEAQVTSVVLPEDAFSKRLTWTSSRPDVVSVDEQGKIIAVAVGTSVITATAQDGSNAQGSISVTVRSNYTGIGRLVITEVQSANIDQFMDPSFNFGSWVELYNPTDQAITLTGCWLGDAQNTRQAQINYPLAIEAQGYAVLWFDHYSQYAPRQINAELDMDGGTLVLSRSSGSEITRVDYPAAIARCSYVRKAVDGSEWAWSSAPTPGTSNEGMTFQASRLSAPVVDQASQFFTTTLGVSVQIPPGTTLRYTTDGSAPTLTNGKESGDGLFYPSATTVYRFGLFADGYLPSPVVTRTYIYKDKDFPLPTFSVSSDERNLWGEDYGILTRGNGNGRPGNGQSTPCNWNMDWDRPVNFEYLTAQGEMVVNQETHMERAGGWSRAWMPYSFKIKASKQYEGQNYLPYGFFTTKPYLRHKTLQIRNGGNDNTCRIKDPALGEIVRSSGLDVDLQGYQPVMHYINGRYAGVINVREPNNKHYVLANYGLDDDEIDQFEMSPDSGYVQKCGTYESMQRWKELSALCGTDDEAYARILQMVDIDEYTNYMALMLYLNSTDWPQNNIKGFKPRMEGGKFRFVAFDMDSALEGGNDNPFTRMAWKQNYTFNRLYGEGIEGQQITKEIEMVSIFLQMLQNDAFRKRFIDTYSLISGSVFQPERCREIINRLASRVSDSQNISSEVYGKGSTPWSTANNLISSLSANRQQQMMAFMKNFYLMGLDGETPLDIQLSANLPQARLSVNDLSVPTNSFNGQLFRPVTLAATAPGGYRFLGWKQVDGSASQTTTLLSDGTSWHYYDGGSLDGTDWTSPTFDDKAWKQGEAPLGYGKTQAVTTTAANLPTYYFRIGFTLDEQPSADAELACNYAVDDGFVLYINGTEAGRYNMPAGQTAYNTFASTYAPGNPDRGTLKLNAALLRKGVNVVAVEVHNNSAASSDILWDAGLTLSQTVAGGDIVSTEPRYTLPEDAGGHLQAVFEPLSTEEKIAAGLSLAPVVINEASAGNSVNANEYFKKDDWVELYNTTDADIDLTGMFLSDDLSQPRKYQITAQGTQANTLLPARGYRLVWCSGRTTQRELHAPFKLGNKELGHVVLTAPDGSWSDTLHYQPHEGTQSVGRYPDGGREIYVMDHTTIAATNRINHYAQRYIYDPSQDPSTGLSALHARENGQSILLQGSSIVVKAEDLAHIDLTIHSVRGYQVLRTTLVLEAGTARFDISGLGSGTYVARAGEVGLTFVVR